MKSKAIEFLEQHESPTVSHWKEKAQWRIVNKPWRKHAKTFAIKIAEAMEEQNLSMEGLCRRLIYGDEVVKHILSGEMNLSLSMIADIEDALDITLIDEYKPKNVEVNSDDNDPQSD